LASRMLRRPLGPTLIILAGPAYLINMQLLLPEKMISAFGLTGLACLLKSLDEDRPAWAVLAGVLIAAALLFKSTAVFVLLLALAAAWRRRSWKWLAVFGGLTAAPLAVVLAHGIVTGSLWAGAAGSAWRSVAQSPATSGRVLADRIRALLAFTGGCGLVTAAWPLLAARRPRRWWLGLLGVGALVALLFCPFLDLSAVDAPQRLWGAAFSAAAVVSLGIFLSRLVRGHPYGGVLTAWAAVVLVLQMFFYWSVVTRYLAFLIIPIVLAQALVLEARLGPEALRRSYAAGFVVLFALSSALARVDYRYAGAQRETARMVAERFPGRRLWFTGHWGFQYYMEKAGASQVDALSGGWQALRPGDIVVIPAVNANLLLPPRRPGVPLPECLVCRERIPLRLIRRGGAGFFSSNLGFLPYSVNREPLDTFGIVEW
ncbi:MAG: hypothetical protein PHU21_05545, partial [Elusimicrobia bacterium]|nr:hypothetical protein [Elusimicrobiota bacterium]